MVIILVRFSLLLSVVLLVVDESPVDDAVADVVVRMLCDHDQPHHLMRRGKQNGPR